MKPILRALISLGACAILCVACETTKSTTTSSSATTSITATKKYPLDVCIVTDNKLGSMGDPIYMDYQGQQVGFCCKPCIKEFEDNPKLYLAKLPPAQP